MLREKKTQEATKIKSSINSDYGVFVASGGFCEKNHHRYPLRMIHTVPFSRAGEKQSDRCRTWFLLDKNGERNAEKHPNGSPGAPAPRGCLT